jgi:hypothetical protein
MYAARINNADGGGRYSPITNQKFRGGSINKSFKFMCLSVRIRESIEIDYLLSFVNKEKKETERRDLKELPHLEIL